MAPAQGFEPCSCRLNRAVPSPSRRDGNGIGADVGNRTPYIGLEDQGRYQLATPAEIGAGSLNRTVSFRSSGGRTHQLCKPGKKWWQGLESNQRKTAYETVWNPILPAVFWSGRRTWN